jgi:hypothetical protein
MCELTAQIAKSKNLGAWTALFPLCGLILLLANPWTIWIDSFDFHPQAIDLFFALLAAHFFWRGSARRGWVAALLALACGAIGATYVAGVGLSSMLAGRRWRRLGAMLLTLGILWLLLISHIGGDRASGVYSNLTQGAHSTSITTYQLIQAIFEHPSRAFSSVWSVRKDMFADIVPGGLIGFFSPWSFGISFLVLVEGSLTGSAGFIEPYVQNSLPFIFLIPLGTIAFCVTLASTRQRWKRILSFFLATLTIINIGGWSITWFHRTESQWVSVSSSTATTLSRALAMIHPGDEVIASQGIMGPFAFRQWIYPLVGGPVASFPIRSRTVWFVMSPGSGIETETTIEAESQIGQIAVQLHARLIIDSNGIFVFKWRPRPHQRSVHFTNVISVPAWSLYSFPSVTVTKGPAKLWHVKQSGSSGYIVSGDYWRLQNGTYTASVKLSSSGKVEVALLDTSTHTVLKKEIFGSTAGSITTKSFTGNVVNLRSPEAYPGYGFFSVKPVEPPPNDILELILLVPRLTHASIYSIGVSNQASEN